MSQTELCREIGCFVAFHSPDTFVGEIHRYSQTGFFYKKALYFIQCPGVTGSRPYIFIVRWRQPPLLKTIQMFVDGTHAVFPQHLLPFGSRQIVFQYPLISVKSHHLAGLFVQIHLTEQVLDACIYRGSRIFVYVFYSVFIKIDPAFFIHFGFHRFVYGRYFH